MERVLSPTTVCYWIGQRANDLGELGNRPGPSVCDDDRQGVGFWGPLVNEVGVETVNYRLVVIKLVQTAFLRAPVKLVTSVGDEFGQVSKVSPIIPVDAIELVWPPRSLQSRPEVFKHCVGDVNGERPDRTGVW